MKNFNELEIENKLKSSIKYSNFITPTPIQSQAIPIALEGKDVLGTAQTGTGKTLAFTIPLINKLIIDKNAMALIICPTRELASQVMGTVSKLTLGDIRIGNALLIGGESMQRQLRQLNKRARIIVGTPGRINDHLKRKSLNLSRVNYLVLDETDRMLDMGFTPQIELILKFIPKEHQTLLFSATLPNNILKIAQKYLDNPERVSVGSLSTPIEKIKLQLLELTKHVYKPGHGEGKGAGFAGGTKRGKVRFIRLKYAGGDWDQDLDLHSDLNMLLWYSANTGHETAPKPEVRTINQLKNFPIGKSPPLVYMTGQKSLGSISSGDKKILNEYLTDKHGMLFADNGGSSSWHSQFFSLMRQVLPGVEPIKVPLDHPVHNGMPFLPIVAP